MPCDLRLLLKVSLYRGSTIVSSCENPRHSTNIMAPLSRAPLNLTIAFFVAVLSKLWRSCRSFFPRRAWRARERCNWPRGTTPTHPPPISRLVWLSLFSISDWVASESSHCFRCSRALLPRSPLSPPPPPPLPFPPPPSASFSRFDQWSPYPCSSRLLFHHQGCSRTAHCMLYLLLLATVVTVFNSSRSAEAMGRSGSRSRRDVKFPRAGTVTTRPKNKAWQLV